MLLIVGLGNPGVKYEHTRHNIGFKVIDTMVADCGARDISKSSFYGELYKSNDILLLKPTTFMNLSGKSVLAVKNFYKIEMDNIIVIHDDIDLPFSALRFKKGGGHGGHNGLRSIDGAIGKEYYRVRMGVDKPEHKSQVADYVLHDFSSEEQQILGEWIEHTASAIEALGEQTLEEVKSRYSLKSFKGK
ncbi:MAG TPA: aminoacyl-tRNA hydrolase [Campylobacterales bacterium]|nr:aminoacyl-tRNA hydrolase [Campylobacterales bacterium]